MKNDPAHPEIRLALALIAAALLASVAVNAGQASFVDHPAGGRKIEQSH